MGVEQRGLVAPMDLAACCVGLCGDGGMRCVERFVDRLGVLRIGARDRLLRGERGTLQIFAGAARGRVDVEGGWMSWGGAARWECEVGARGARGRERCARGVGRRAPRAAGAAGGGEGRNDMVNGRLRLYCLFIHLR